MVKMIGLSRAIKVEWLNKTVELIKQGKTELEIKYLLNEYLSFEISSPTNLRKTREILMSIWVRTPNEYISIREHALDAFDKTEDKLSVHWCMILLSYPVFVDVCSMIGKMADIQGTFTTSWLKQKLFDVWGERTTLYHSTDKILQTLKNIGAIKNVKVGQYRIENRITSPTLITLLTWTILTVGEQAYYGVGDLSQVPFMFPFDYTVTYEVLYNTPMFTLNSYRGDVKVELSNK